MINRDLKPVAADSRELAIQTHVIKIIKIIRIKKSYQVS